VGVPPLIGVAVKVTDVPAQIDPEGLADILTLAESVGLTVINLRSDTPLQDPPWAVSVKVTMDAEVIDAV
jgi:hypothetical protein